MATCEDAPCCGCCGPAVWAADAAAEEEAYWDRMNDPYADDGREFFEEDEEDEEEWEPDPREDFGYFGDEALCGE